jgi:hypothetical protein
MVYNCGKWSEVKALVIYVHISSCSYELFCKPSNFRQRVRKVIKEVM